MRCTSGPSRRIFGLLLAVLFTVSCFSFSTVNADQTKPLDATVEVAGMVENSFAIIYKCRINTPGSFSNVRLKVEFQKYAPEASECTWETTEITEYKFDNGEYTFVFNGISAAEMGNTVKGTLCADNGGQTYAGGTVSLSLKQYALYLLSLCEGSAEQFNIKLCTLLVDMLNYGAAAQLYFKVNTGDLVNKDLTVSQRSLGTPRIENPSSCWKDKPLSNASADIESVALLLGNNVDLAAVVTFDDGTSAGTFAEMSYTGINGQKYIKKVTSNDFEKQADGKYKVRFNDVNALYFRSSFDLVIREGDKAVSSTKTYSYESYASAVVNGDYPSELKDLVKYMVTLGESSKAFVESYNSGSGGEAGGETGGETGGDEDPLTTYKNSKYTENMPEAVIVLPKNATAEEQYAAEILAKYIAMEDGYTPAVINDTASKGSRGFEISVGNTNRPHGTLSTSADGAYKIKSYDGGIAITGNGKRGTIDGAVKFLSVCGGYFWLSFEDGYITHQDHFKYSASIDIEQERAFVFTDIDVMFGKTDAGENRMFSLSGGLNGFYVNLNVSNRPGYQSWYLSNADEDAYGGLQPGQAHTLLAEFVPPSKYYASHPEYYAKVKTDDGYVRSTDQLCLSNPDVYPIIRDHVFDILKNGGYDKNAPMQIISLSQADNGTLCMCSDCVNFRLAHESSNKKEGLLDAALYLQLCNNISKEVKAAGYKNVYIDMLAYVWNNKPPVGMTVDDHVIIRYAAIERCYAHDCDDPDCVRNGGEMYSYLKGWADLCRGEGNGQLWIWDYNADWQYTCGPYLNISALSHDIKHYYDLGVTGIYLQSNDAHNRLNTEFGDLRIYLGNVLLENPEADVDKEMEFFCNEFYGKSGQYIIEAMHVMEKQAKNHSNVGPNHEAGTNAYYFRNKVMTYNASASQMFANYYPKEMDAQNQMPQSELAKCESLWNQALEACAGDTGIHQYRTRRTHLCWRYVKSNMKVYEFSTPSTYKKKNTELYNDIFTTYGNEFYSLIYRDKPPTEYLGHVPDAWCSSEDRGASY